MDQLKKILAGMQKNSFWIVSGLTIILGIVGYWMSRSTMDKIFAEQSGKIDTHYAALQTISGEVSTHPNAKTHEEMDKQIQALVSDVETAWKKQYERQAEFMKWPADLPPSLLAKVEKLRPIELKLEYPLAPGTDPLVRGDLANYAKYVNTQFPALAKIIGTEWVGTPPVAAAGGMGGMGGSAMGGYGAGMASGSSDPTAGYGAAGMDPSSGYGGSGMAGYGAGMAGAGMTGYGAASVQMPTDLVIWPKPVQDAVLADVQMWRGAVPTTHEVLYTQENIWILEGLLKIIAQVNAKANAVANFQATVKEIEFLRIGRSAVGRVGTIDRPGAAGGMGGYGGSMAMGIGMEEGMEGMGEMATSSDEMPSDSGDAGISGGGEDGEGMYGGMVAATPDPANGRYVDAAYAPLTGEDLRTKMKSSSPEDAYFAVAKRVPVRLRLKVDQRRIQTLVAECGNADLMFEIRQIRIGDTTPAPAAGAGGGYGMNMYGSGEGGSGMGGYGGMMGGEGSSGSGYGMDSGSGGMPGYGMGGMGGMGGYGMGGMVGQGPSKVWDIPVELYGVIYLFNPVDTGKLGLEKVTAETEVADKVEVSADEAQAAAPAAEPTPEGQTPPADGQPAPAGTEPPSQTPAAAGQAPGTQAPATQPPGGQVPGGQAPGQTPGAANGQVPNAGGQVPGGQVPGGQVPGGQVPGSQVPGGQVPGGQGPGSQVPGGQVPGGQVPGGQGAGGQGPNAAGTPAAPANPGGAAPNGGAAPAGSPPAAAGQ